MRNPLDLESLLSRGDYAWEYLAAEDVRILHHVIYCAAPVTNHYQSMNIVVPAAYVNDDGRIDHDARVNGFGPDTAPVIFRNNCSGWMSSDPDSNEGTFTIKDVAGSGCVYVSCGARSRDLGRLGKMPAPIADLKAGIRFLRLNSGCLPGRMDRIISIGGSGAGEMSSVLGASGNDPDFFPWLYEIGAAGVDRREDGSYESTIPDDIYGCMCYYPITDIENADLAYAWTRFDTGEDSVTLGGGGLKGTVAFTPFKLALQRDMAEAFADYINGLELRTPEGETLSFPAQGTDRLRQGSYYGRILDNLSDALNARLAAESDPEGWLLGRCGRDGALPTWLERDGERYRVTDMAGFLNGTGLLRNKDIPGFDTFWKYAENNGFGGERDSACHYSPLTARLLAYNRERYSRLAGFDGCDVDSYIAEPEREPVPTQTRLMNSTHMLLRNARGEKRADVAPFWRIRSGTADQHTSFSVGYNLALAAMENPGVQADYALVWDMPHGGEKEGETTGTFLRWMQTIL